MTWSTRNATYKLALPAVLALVAVTLLSRRHGEVWHTLG